MRTQIFGGVHLLTSLNQRIMNGTAEQEKHQRIPLFATFNLRHGVVCRSARTKSNKVLKPGTLHTLTSWRSKDVVVRSHAVNGEYGGCGSVSVNALIACPTQFVPALVESAKSANWNGAQTALLLC